jgi:hypothetical protein
LPERAVAGCGQPNAESIAMKALRLRIASAISASVEGTPTGRTGSKSKGNRTMRSTSSSWSAFAPIAFVAGIARGRLSVV